MAHHDIFENRKQFQLERLILFSDAVFAIAITLLVLEIRVPQSDWSKIISKEQLNEYIIEIIPNMVGYLFSFFIIGFYWTIHHSIFGHVINYDGKLIWLNLLMLFFIAFLPFTTTLTSEYGYLSESYIYYWMNVALIGLVSFFIQLHTGNPKKNLSAGFESEQHRRFAQSRALYTSMVFFLGAFFAMTSSNILQAASKYIYIIIFPGMLILKKVYKIKKQPHKHS